MSATTAPSLANAHVLRKVWKFGANIDTDQLAPGHAMKHGMDTVAAHCLESANSEFASKVRPGDVIVAGAGFGIGSSREQAASVLVHLGVAAVIAPSYSGLYIRNAFNVGLLLLTCKQAEVLQHHEQVTIDLSTLTVMSSAKTKLPCEPIPQFLLDMVHAGGLLPQLKQRLSKQRAEAAA